MASTKLVCKTSLALSSSLAPIQRAKTTLAPMDRPVKKVTIILITGALDPTAAMA